MMSDLQVLMAARKLLMDPKRWYKGSLIHNNRDTNEPCYCAIGALGAACGVQWERRERDYPRGTNIVSYFIQNAPADVEEQWIRVSGILARYVNEDQLDKDLLYEAQDEHGGGSYAEQAAPEVFVFNDQDTTKYEDVMELFSRAIQALVAEQAEQEVAVS